MIYPAVEGWGWQNINASVRGKKNKNTSHVGQNIYVFLPAGVKSD